jgi:hypothetical protein
MVLSGRVGRKVVAGLAAAGLAVAGITGWAIGSFAASAPTGTSVCIATSTTKNQAVVNPLNGTCPSNYNLVTLANNSDVLSLYNRLSTDETTITALQSQVKTVTVYGRTTGINLGAATLFHAAPSGVTAAAGSGGDTMSEELSPTSSATIKNLTVQLVARGSDAAAPVPTDTFVNVDLTKPSGFSATFCTVFGGQSSCTSSIVGTIPAGTFLKLVVASGSLIPNYFPDVVFTYQVVYG